MGQAEGDRHRIRDTRTVLPLDVLTTDSCLLHHYSPTHIPTNPDGLEEQGVSHRCWLCLVPRKSFRPACLPTPALSLGSLAQKAPPCLEIRNKSCLQEALRQTDKPAPESEDPRGPKKGEDDIELQTSGGKFPGNLSLGT